MNQSTADNCILGMKVSTTDYSHASDLIINWAKQGSSKYVCVATVNNVMESYDSIVCRSAMNGADLVTPDGMPLVWGLKLFGRSQATRVYGPDLTPIVISLAAKENIPVGFYGSSPSTLTCLVDRVKEQNPSLRVAYSFSPPFRPVSPNEDIEIIRAINESGAKILFVGLNSPKQDLWMSAHRPEVQAVMIGVGAAFDFIAGSKKQAPRWMMKVGLEWLFRLATEPKRLWKRYLKHNPRFIVYFGMQLLGLKRFDCRPDEMPEAQQPGTKRTSL
jgi:N-acetylglucosaminyldiphosphoundecaprenol N-acetyl-beta-D-mannosaminyltransferase